MKSENQICRLCLNTCGIFESISEATREILNKLQLDNIDLSKTDCPVMCEKCSTAIQKWFDFKSTCLQAQAYIDQASSNKQENISENDRTCCLCTKTITPADYSVSLNTEDKAITSMKITLLKHFSEMDTNCIKDPVVCAPCSENLDACSAFVTTCLESEEKIKKYCQDNAVDSTEHIELCYVIENKHFIWLDEIKTEDTYSTAKESTYVDASIILKTEDNKVKIKYDDLEQKMDIKYEDISSDQSPRRSALCNSELVEIKTHKCGICEYQTKFKSSLHRHMITHKSISEVTMYKCTDCSYETRHKIGLQRHTIIHKSASEVTMYKCAHCSYETKRKINLRRHAIVHKSNSEVTMHRCAQCDFETKRKRSLIAHMLIHRSADEATVFHCHLCEYHTKIKCYLNKHMISHKSSSEVTMHKCQVCEYQTKLKANLKTHMLIHRSSSEVVMHKCTECSFETKRKCYLRKHMIVHESSANVAMYKCTVCNFETKHKSSLRVHVIKIHKRDSDVIADGVALG